MGLQVEARPQWRSCETLGSFGCTEIHTAAWNGLRPNILTSDKDGVRENDGCNCNAEIDGDPSSGHSHCFPEWNPERARKFT